VTSVGYESQKWTQGAVQGGLLGGHKSAPVRQNHLLTPSLQLPANK